MCAGVFVQSAYWLDDDRLRGEAASVPLYWVQLEEDGETLGVQEPIRQLDFLIVANLLFSHLKSVCRIAYPDRCKHALILLSKITISRLHSLHTHRYKLFYRHL